MQTKMLENIVETLKMSVLFNMKSGSNFTETILPMLLVSFCSYIMTCNPEQMNKIYNNISNYISNSIFDYNKLYKSFGISQKRSISIEGKRCFKAGEFTTRVDNLFSDRFQAIWFKLANKRENNETIYNVKELADFTEYIESDRPSYQDEFIKSKELDVLIVDQTTPFIMDIGMDINCRVTISKDSMECGNKKSVNTIEIIEIEIFSYKRTLNELIKYIDDITRNFVIQIQNVRLNKTFIYTYLGAPKEENRCSNNFSSWEECEFKSFRTFDNLFFDAKEKLLNKLNFYIKNKAWYKKEGHPYTFGIGLTGPPGTGKTSVIKCIANKLNRHLIVIPLNKLKTQREFSACFFENRYNRNNAVNSIDFENKIIVFEDIDCMTDIVKQRNKKKSNANKLNANANKLNANAGLKTDDNDDNDDDNDDNDNDDNDNDNDTNSEKLLKQLTDQISPANNLLTMLNSTSDDKITLSYLLNIIDGIRETPGRIMIITSNNYNSLDKALVRPGRIDFTLEMNNASITTIKNMFFHYYKYEIPEDIKCKLKDNKISPAQIVSYSLECSSGEEFLSKLV
jgi:SpoVK/Ycf46/Vps4 family AAA+-type ATPase